MSRKVRIGIDVGGTFTDLFLSIDPGNAVFRHKLPSTPANPHEAPIAGIREIMQIANVAPEEIEFVGLGTTVATNALLERKGAKAALVTTRGFRDVLENGRQGRPHVYNLHTRKPRPLIPRDLRLEVSERITADGEVLKALSPSEVEKISKHLRKIGVESVAICFLNSYKDDRHERECAALMRRLLPGCPVSVSSEILPEFREYERVSTVAVNSFLSPLMKRYLTSFQSSVAQLGIQVAPFVMNSGGGVISPETAAGRPVDTLLSGPSGGVSGAAYLARMAGHPDVITFDMGGTSTDVALLRDCQFELARQRVIDGIPFKSAAVDVHSVGAGGSSIAWIDEGGLLRVGPESAGAAPGPACYQRGGSSPTVTDANVVLGRLNDKFLLDGALKIDSNASVQAIKRGIARHKRLDIDSAAQAIIAIANQNIAEAIRFISVNRGIDPREFVLVAFGGAGPIHAAEVAREIGMKGVLVPESPGVLCAMGVLTKDVRADTSRTVLVRQSTRDLLPLLKRAFKDSADRATKQVCGQKKKDGVIIERSVDVRYVGQNHELLVSVPDGPLDPKAVVLIRERFDAAHHRLFGYDRPDKDMEIVNVRAAAVLPVPLLSLSRNGLSAGNPKPDRVRQTYFAGWTERMETAVYDRSQLHAGARVSGPAIVEQFDTTTLIPPDYHGSVDAMGNLLLSAARK